MSKRSIIFSWDFLISLCSEGTRFVWPDVPDEAAICVGGLSTGATAEGVIVNPDDRTITVMCDDPAGEGEIAWRKVREG